MNSQSNVFTDQEIKEILDKDVLDSLDMANVPDEKKAEFYETMNQTVQNRVISRIDEKLDDNDREEWLKLVDEGDQSKMHSFLQQKNIDPAKLVVEEAIIYKMEIVSLYKQAKEK